MSRVIHKVALRLDNPVVPRDAEILDIQVQHNVITAWYITAYDGDNRGASVRRLQVCGTGFNAPEMGQVKYLATVQHEGYVWHFFDPAPPSRTV